MPELDKIVGYVKSLGLRKVGLAVYMFSVLSILVGFNKIQDSTFNALGMAIVGAAFAGLTAEHFSPKKESEA